MIAYLLPFAAVCLAALLARSRPSHRPLAVALYVALFLDAARRIGLPPRVALASYFLSVLAGPWAAASLVWRAGPLALGAVVWAVVVAAVALPAAWPVIVAALPICAVLAQAGALFAWLLTEGIDHGPSVTVRCLLLLAAVDLAALGGPVLWGGPWDAARVAANVAAVGLCCVQGWELYTREPKPTIFRRGTRRGA